MKPCRYSSGKPESQLNRRSFLKASALAGGLILGNPTLWSQEQEKKEQQAQPAAPTTPKTNVDDFMKVPSSAHALPAPFPGKVVEVHDPAAVREGQINAPVVADMFRKGMEGLTGRSLPDSFGLFFNPRDVVGLKVNPVGAGLISTRLELVDAVIDWLVKAGLPKSQIIIWDRFDYMLTEAGFTPERFPGIKIEGLQTMDPSEDPNKTELDAVKNGLHISRDLFDQQAFYWADVEAPQDNTYLNQHVFNGKESYFGKLVTQKLTKIINLPVFKNTGNGISMATKNIGYGAVCNTSRLHRPLFFNVCTEVTAAPWIRNKMVLNVTDGLRAQYDGGPGPAAQFTWDYNRLFMASDPIALDMVCHQLLTEKRKSAGVKTNEHPRFTEYLHYAEKLGLGIADLSKIKHLRV
jgi:hypothetical protein